MKTVPVATLDRTMRTALLRRGLSEEHAGWVVDGLLETSLRGVDTHGVRLFPTYIAELDGGRSRARPEMTWIGDPAPRHAARLLDAGAALGLVAGRFACAEAVRLAREHGVGTVAVRNSNHFGAASVYTLAMARQGVLGMSFTNSDALVAPFHGVRPIFGTNPISLAVQGEGDDLFCADFATSQVSYSKVKHYNAQGIQLEPGWAVTADGRDAAEEEAGEVSALKPLGGHKGQCLGMMVEILCALLGGMPLDHELSHLYGEPYDEPRQVAHLFLAYDIAAFQNPAAFRASLSRLLRLVREQPAVEGERVIVPGDLESEETARRRVEGIPLTEGEAAAFERIEREV